MLWILPISLLIAFEAIADILAKEYSLTPRWYWWIGALAAYVVANMFWLSAIGKGSGLARGGSIFSVGSAVLAVIIGLVFYKEKVSSTSMVGMLLGIVAIMLIVQSED